MSTIRRLGKSKWPRMVRQRRIRNRARRSRRARKRRTGIKRAKRR